MLKGIDPILTPDLLQALAAMGHGDEIAIVDGNYPAEEHARRLIRLDGIPAPRIAEAILSIMPLDDFVAQAAFRPAAYNDPARVEPVLEELKAVVAKYEPKIEVFPLVGPAFYDRVKAAYAVVASGERRLFGNLILRKGVIYPK